MGGHPQVLKTSITKVIFPNKAFEERLHEIWRRREWSQICKTIRQFFANSFDDGRHTFCKAFAFCFVQQSNT